MIWVLEWVGVEYVVDRWAGRWAGTTYAIWQRRMDGGEGKVVAKGERRRMWRIMGWSVGV